MCSKLSYHTNKLVYYMHSLVMCYDKGLSQQGHMEKQEMEMKRKLETENGNGNWKQKGVQNTHQSLVQCFLHSACAWPLLLYST